MTETGNSLLGLTRTRLDKAGKLRLPPICKKRWPLVEAFIGFDLQDDCLLLFNSLDLAQHYYRLAQEYADPNIQPQGAQLQPLPVDSDGDLIIPAALVKLMGLAYPEDLVLVGEQDHLSLWHSRAWEKRASQYRDEDPGDDETGIRLGDFWF